MSKSGRSFIHTRVTTIYQSTEAKRSTHLVVAAAAGRRLPVGQGAEEGMEAGAALPAVGAA